jgi:hypothetical protein
MTVMIKPAIGALIAVVMAAMTAAPAGAAPRLYHCAGARVDGRLSVSRDPGPGCDGAAVLARKVLAAAKRRFPRPLPKRYDVWVPGAPADASASTARFRCRVHSEVAESRREGHPVRVTVARCANGRGSRFRYSFSMA